MSLLTDKQHRSWLITFCLFFLIYLVSATLRPLWVPDEVRYSAMAFEMASSDNWVVPMLAGLRYFEKPIFDLWVNALSFELFGFSNLTVRFGSIVATFVMAIMVHNFARIHFSVRVAHISTLIYLSSLLVFATGGYGSLDAMLSVWLTAGLIALYHGLMATETPQRLRAFVVAGVCFGFAMLTKGFLAWAIPFIIALPFSLLTGRFSLLLKWGPLMVVLAALVAVPWGVAVHFAEADYWRYFFIEEHIHRFFSSNAEHKSPSWFYLPVLFLGVLPWSIMALRTLYRADYRNIVSKSPAGLYLVLWLGLSLLFFSMSNGKLVGYLAPLMPAVSILLALGVNKRIKRNKGFNHLLAIFIYMAIGTTIIISGEIGHVLYSDAENMEKWLFLFSLSLAAFISMIGHLTPTITRKLQLAALAIVPVYTAAATILPNKLIDHQLPQGFYQQTDALLEQCDQIVSDKYMLTATTWYLHRTDITMMGQQGEFDYGLAYPDAAHRYLTEPMLQQMDDIQLAKQCFVVRRGREVEAMIKREPRLHRVSHDHAIAIYKMN